MARPITYDREDIIKKAQNVFWEKGYLDTSIQDLENATGLVRTSLYSAFGSKKGLYLASLKFYQDNTIEFLNEYFKGDQNPLKKIYSFFKYSTQNVCTDPANKGCFLANANNERNAICQDAQQILETNKSVVIRIFVNQINKAKDQKLIDKKVNSNILAIALYTLQLGLASSAKHSFSKKELDSTIKMTLKGLLRSSN